MRSAIRSSSDASAVIIKNGGKVLGSVRPPFATPDLSSFILQAQASKAKIIGIAGGPPNNMNEIKTGGEFGVFKGGQQMAALLALITDIHSLGLPAAQGLLLTTSFYWDMDDKTREWSKRYFAKMNRMPTMWQAGVYSSVMHYLNAVKDSRHRRAAQGGGEDARKADRGFLCPQRQAARGQSDGARPHAGPGQDAGRVQISVGLLQDPGEDLRRGGVRAARSGLLAGEEEVGLATCRVVRARAEPVIGRASARPVGLAGTTGIYFTTPISRKYLSTPGWISSTLGPPHAVRGGGSASLRQFPAECIFRTMPRPRWLIGFPAGGPVDTVARIMSQALSEHFGQQFVVENRAGSGGNIATEAAINSPPDGYTLLFSGANNAISASLYKKLPFDFIRDTVPVAISRRCPTCWWCRTPCRSGPCRN